MRPEHTLIPCQVRDSRGDGGRRCVSLDGDRCFESPRPNGGLLRRCSGMRDSHRQCENKVLLGACHASSIAHLPYLETEDRKECHRYHFIEDVTLGSDSEVGVSITARSMDEVRARSLMF